MRKELELFVQEMEARLQEKDDQHPTGWSQDAIFDLLFRLDERVGDVFVSLQDEEDESKLSNEEIKVIHSLAIDIANFAMMVADKTK